MQILKINDVAFNYVQYMHNDLTTVIHSCVDRVVTKFLAFDF